MATVNIYHTCPTNPSVATLILTPGGNTDCRAVKQACKVASVTSTNITVIYECLFPAVSRSRLRKHTGLRRLHFMDDLEHFGWGNHKRFLRKVLDIACYEE